MPDIQDPHQDAWHTDTPDAFRWAMDHAFGSGRGDRFQTRKDGIPVNWGYEYVLNRENSTLTVSENNLKCNICGMSLSTKWNLKRHIERVHKLKR